MGGHGSFGSVSSSLMGVTLGYPSGHPDPHSSIIASVVESQSTASSAVITTSTVSADTSDLPPIGLLARQPPIGIETAAATNPTLVPALYSIASRGQKSVVSVRYHSSFLTASTLTMTSSCVYGSRPWLAGDRKSRLYRSSFMVSKDRLVEPLVKGS